MKYIKYKKDLNENMIHNLIISTLLSFGSLSGYSSMTEPIKKEIISKIEEDSDIKDTINFIKLNKISLGEEYNYFKIKNDYELSFNSNFENVLSKLNKKQSPIYVSVSTFDIEHLGLYKIPVMDISLYLNKNLKISFWDSGWTPQGNIVGVGITKGF